MIIGGYPVPGAGHRPDPATPLYVAFRGFVTLPECPAAIRIPVSPLN